MYLRESDDPVETWAQAERYLGGGTRTYSRFSADLEISRRYHPQHGDDSFSLPTVVVPDGDGVYLRNGLPSALHPRYRGDSWFLLPVHPDTGDHPELFGRERLRELPAGPVIEAVPTANARTVLVRRIGGEPVPPHFLKLHYPRRLSRFARRLRRPMIELQLWVAGELDRAEVPFLPEVAGGVFGTDPAEGWGYVVREHQLTGGGSLPVTVPLFALYGQDVRAPEDPPLVVQLVERSGLPAAEFLRRQVVAPLVVLWWRAVARTGCLPEPHGQNALVTFDLRHGACRVGYRDCGIYVDPAVRKQKGIAGDLPPRNVLSVDVDVPAGQVMSLVYDTFMGHHALAYLAETARQWLGVPPEVLPAAARRAFHAAADPSVVLPEHVYNYDDRLHPDGQWQLADTGEHPRWR